MTSSKPILVAVILKLTSRLPLLLVLGISVPAGFCAARVFCPLSGLSFLPARIEYLRCVP